MTVAIQYMGIYNNTYDTESTVHVSDQADSIAALIFEFYSKFKIDCIFMQMQMNSPCVI